MAEARPLDLVTAGAVLQQPRNRSPSARWPMRRMPFGVSSMRPSRCSIRPASSSICASSEQLLQRARRVVAEQVADAVEVDLGELARVRRVAHQVLERVDVAELVEQAAHALNGSGSSPRNLMPWPHPICGNALRRFWPSWSICQRRSMSSSSAFGELLELRALLGAHGVEQLLHLRHRLRHLLEQLVEGLRIAGEEVAEAVHEPFEIGLLAALASARASG